MALIIGVTGGIGSGKSTVCQIFRILGVPVFEADLAGKELLNTNKELKNKIIEIFGNEICRDDGEVDRAKLAGIIFNDNIKLQKINALVHPFVKEEFLKWTNEKKDVPYVIHEAAILFESGFHQMMDYIILVTAPEEQRIGRVMKRDGVSRNTVIQRIKNQFPENKKEKMASIILRNDNSRLIIPEILKIDKYLKEYGKIW